MTMIPPLEFMRIGQCLSKKVLHSASSAFRLQGEKCSSIVGPTKDCEATGLRIQSNHEGVKFDETILHCHTTPVLVW